MRLAIWSNAPWTPTGYGTQTAQLSKRLKADGHEVAVIANYGLAGSPMETDGISLYPTGSHPYSLDVADTFAEHWFGGGRGLIIVLYDTWPLLEKKDLFQKHDAFYWAPVDHAPPPPKVIDWCRDHDIIAMSEFGRDELAKSGIPPAYTIHHGIERSQFSPTESDIRKKMEVPEDAHLTVGVLANIGQAPVRKAFFEQLYAWRLFAEQHEDAYLYLHTHLQHPRGIDLATFIKLWGLPQDRIRVVDQGSFAAGLIDQSKMAALFSAADVTLMATCGEGFGLPAAESLSCGTPVIGTDFSAQPEIIGNAGWLVQYVPLWDYGQGSVQATPLIGGIVDALNNSYATSKDEGERDAMREVCLEQAGRFDADAIYEQKWRPFIKDREPAKPNRQMRRANKEQDA